ncbi:hypothetical protein IHE49_12570 [Rhodanobacter sp. 7MK24]|uniref:hypothetical protein n=1 Tax=Rhodanobacter sp. 7MK24 TaxID=2775922 RepID=UPI00177F3940|nr:hypothetical protein [Rhodanobacter sp. 7MK24]MBD8881317.1 hypothetical protein [Rhodanobacter sp. 7MK24]
MRRLLAPMLLCLLPFVAAGQGVDDANGQLAGQLLKQPPAQVAKVKSGLAVPLWRGTDGRLLVLKADGSNGAQAQRDSLLSPHAVDASTLVSTGLQYGLAPNWQANADVSQQSWVNSPLRVVGSEVGATYFNGPYSLGVSVGSNSTPNSTSLPRVLPGVTPSVDGLTGFDSSSQLNARGRLALGTNSGVDVGASVGRIHLLPGNLLGISTLDQKAISFGVDHGPISGTLIGRTMQPLAGVPGNGYSPDRRWNSIDLGVTWHLPWQGSLSVGAQNLWSSGAPTNTPAGPEPDQSRTPYVQYHQDL